jgi:hypothetical protein
MPGLASIFRRPLFRRTQLFPQSGNAAATSNVESPGSSVRADESNESPTRGHASNRTEAERLERVAAYARAGYFNLGYTYEMFHLAGELPPPE